jgi:rhodanese-related sulfurtransferase
VNFEIPYPEITRVSLDDSKKVFDDGSAIFLDVRDAGTFGSKHISNSINIPLTELESRLNELPKDRWIITVCT